MATTPDPSDPRLEFACARELCDGEVVALGDVRAVFKTVVDDQPMPPPLWG